MYRKRKTENRSERDSSGSRSPRWWWEIDFGWMVRRKKCWGARLRQEGKEVAVLMRRGRTQVENERTRFFEERKV